MVHRGALIGTALLGVGAVSCGGSATTATASPKASSAERAEAGSFAEERGWGRFHSKRFQLSIPLPDGKNWKIDDHSASALAARHEATSSRLSVLATYEQDLMNRRRCEERAKNIGFVPSTPLTTVDDAVVVGPEAYDSRVWVALDPGRPGGRIEGHVYLFGAFIRRCLLVHVSTSVASAKDEGALASRLALLRARVVSGIVLDPPRTTDDATVPKDVPESRHR